ncbi:MAG TPA: 5-(carboxyamino)imidazole ribonucleotide synthase [Thermomicrobiaceae bacterium]|nr:5-(carboxyamino)imidazole ribonucleotide synthase [Thermomicrobiaceae bacterium]
MKLGIIGGGQLGRMLALAAYPLGIDVRTLEPSPDAPAGRLTEQIIAAYDDRQALAAFAAGLDLVTYEFENVPVQSAAFLAERLPVHPGPRALEVAQDRLHEKTFFRSLNIPTPGFAPVASPAELRRAVADLGLPAVLKTRRLGYDGKGQYVIARAADLDAAWEALGGVPLILEEHVDFSRELSILAARSTGGEIALYPLVENHHRGGILRLSLAPAPDRDGALNRQAESLARRVLEELGYAGLLAIELFERDGVLLANEMAPRVHNSGHWTIEGAETSQFEQHLRAITGLPLGATTARGLSAMVNLIGTLPPIEPILALPGAHLHLYQKAPRPGRKLGHITLRAADTRKLQQTVLAIAQLVPELPARSLI